jgi:hypothetical protein
MSKTNDNDDRQETTDEIISAINAAKDVEAACNRAVNLRQLFVCSEIASKLAGGPSELDRNQWFQTLSDLVSWCNSGAFASDEILGLGGEPLQLMPLREIDKSGREVTINCVGALLIPPPACKRFLERNDSENAPRFLRVWFAGNRTGRQTRRISTTGQPGPKPVVCATLKTKMLSDLRASKLSADELQKYTLEALKAAYGGSPNTAKRARAEAISEFQDSPNSEKP